MDQLIQKFDLTPPTEKVAEQQQPAQPSFPIIGVPSPESSKLYEKLVDSEYMYFRKLTRLLYSADLVPSDKPDSESPLDGFKLRKLEYKGIWKPNINSLGYYTVTNLLLIALADAISTTKINPNKFDVNGFCVVVTMSIIDMLCCNCKTWDFENAHLIDPLGIIIFESIYAVINRSVGERVTLMDRIFNPAIFGINQKDESQSDKGKFNWLAFGK